MPQTLAYSVPEKWPTEPELSVSEGVAVLRIPPPPRWLYIVGIIGSAMFLVPVSTLIVGLSLALKYLGFSALIGLVSPALIFDGVILLAGIALSSIEIWNNVRFGNPGTELRACSGKLHFCRLTFLRGIRTSSYDADQIVELGTEAKEGRRGKTRMTLHIRLRRRFPIRRVMKSSDPSLPVNVENAFRAALGIGGAGSTVKGGHKPISEIGL